VFRWVLASACFFLFKHQCKRMQTLMTVQEQPSYFSCSAGAEILKRMLVIQHPFYSTSVSNQPLSHQSLTDNY